MDCVIFVFSHNEKVPVHLEGQCENVPKNNKDCFGFHVHVVFGSRLEKRLLDVYLTVISSVPHQKLPSSSSSSP